MLGDDIKAVGSGRWSFGDGVSKVFDSHISKSVPGYDLAHNLAVEMSADFVGKGSVVLDIGCSTGRYALGLSTRLPDTEFNYFGLDNETEMIEKCVEACFDQRFQFEVCAAEDKQLSDIDLAISMFTLQFIRPKVRFNVLRNIYQSLNWGGGFMFFEKVRGDDARFNDLLTDWYYSFKRANGYSDEEIALKRESLRYVMEPFSSQGNEELLKEAGFVDICSIFQAGPFKGWLCIK